MIRYLDICSGYSALTQAVVGMDFECVGYAEIDAFPSAMLGYHYGATRARYMPDPEAEGIDAKERKNRIKMAKSMATLHDSHFGNRVTNFGDFSQIREDDIHGPVHLLTGGTPCQSFSVAGKRLGLDDPRGNLTLEFLALARRLRVEWLAFENVPGMLSHDEGRTMGTFLGLLGELGYGWAYRVLDAQYIRVDRFQRAVPQRRKRLILVGHIGDAAGPAAVLFDRASLRGDPAPRRSAGEGITHAVAPSLVSSGRGVERGGETRGQDPVIAVAQGFGGNNTAGPIDIATSLSAHGGPHGRLDFESETLIVNPVAASLTRGAESAGAGGYAGRRQEDDTNIVAHAFDASEDGSGRGTPIVPVAIPFDTTQITSAANYSNPQPGDPSHPLAAHAHVPAIAIAFSMRGRDGEAQAEPAPDGVAPSLRTAEGGSSHAFVAQQWAVRRLTPKEAERLMGCSDGFTHILYRGKPAADGPRYKSLGNSQAINKMRWVAIGLRDVIDIRRGAK